MAVQTVKLNDIIMALPKSKIKAGDGINKGKYKFFTCSPIQSKYYDSFTYEGESLIMGTGGNANIHYCNEKFATSTDCLVFQKKGNLDINLKCVYYLLYGNIDLLQRGFKGCGLQHISKDYILNIEINLPERNVQDKIVDIFDRYNRIKQLKMDEITAYDNLVKSQFIEMFGAINSADYVDMASLCKIITDGTHQPPKFVDEGIPFLFVSNLANNEISYETTKFIDRDTYNRLIKRTPIAVGDILLSTVGSYGHPAIVKSDNEFCFQRHIAYLKPNCSMVDSVYLYGALLSADCQRQIEEKVKGIAQKTLNLSEIKKLMIPLPDKIQQNEFARFVEQTDKSKIPYGFEVAA